MHRGDIIFILLVHVNFKPAKYINWFDKHLPPFKEIIVDSFGLNSDNFFY